MATMGLSGGITASFGNWVGGFGDALREQTARRRLYNATLKELAGLSDRDLQDIGISRLQIADIARDAAYGGR